MQASKSREVLLAAVLGSLIALFAGSGAAGQLAPLPDAESAVAEEHSQNSENSTATAEPAETSQPAESGETPVIPTAERSDDAGREVAENEEVIPGTGGVEQVEEAESAGTETDKAAYGSESGTEGQEPLPAISRVKDSLSRKVVRPIKESISSVTAAAEEKIEQATPAKETVIKKKKSLKKWMKYNGWRVGVIVAITFVCLFATDVFAKFVLDLFIKHKDDLEVRKRARTLSSAVRFVLMIMVVSVAALMIMHELELHIGPILAGAGVLGLAVGLGTQNLFKDLIAGIFILWEDQIRVGDVVRIADKKGYVEKVTLRMVVLRDVGGNVHFIPTGEIHVVTNQTKDFSRYLFEISVAYKEDVDEVIEVMKQVDEDLRSDPDFADLILEPLDVLGLDRFDSSGMVIKARTKTLPIKQWKVGREYNKRLKKKFDEVGIEIPFPHLTLYPGETKSGNAPAFRVLNEPATNNNGH